MELFVKIVNGLKLITIFMKNSNLDVRLRSEYAFVKTSLDNKDNSLWVNTVRYFCQKLHLRCLTGFEISLCGLTLCSCLRSLGRNIHCTYCIEPNLHISLSVLSRGFCKLLQVVPLSSPSSLLSSFDDLAKSLHYHDGPGCCFCWRIS